MAHKDSYYNLDKSLEFEINLAKFSDTSKQKNQNEQNQQKFQLEESFPISFNSNQYQQGSDSDLNSTAMPSSDKQTPGYLSCNVLLESIPIHTYSDTLKNTSNQGKLAQQLDLNFNAQKFNDSSQQQSTASQCEKEEKQGNQFYNQDILESFPIQVNFQKVEEQQLNEKSVLTNDCSSSVSTQSNFSENYFKNNNSNLLSYQPQSQQQLRQQSQQSDQTEPKGKQNKQLCNSTGGIQNIQRGQGLAGTQIINEIQKSESSEDESIPAQSFDPDIISNTNHKKNKQYIQNFDLKLLDQNNKPAKVLQSEGKQKVIIGRQATGKPNPPDIQIDCNTVSGKHAQIVWKPQKITWCLSDEGSTNGTYLIINNSPIKVDDEIMIGLHLVKVVKITKDFPIQVELLFENSVEDTPQFTVIGKVDLGMKFMIGKNHQKQLESDFLVQNDHCFIFFENKKLKIQNCENVQYKTAKKLDKTKQVDLSANSVIRFGFFNQYQFTPYTKVLEVTIEVPGIQKQSSKKEKKCRICGKETQTLYTLVPCSHDQFCQFCALSLATCPICKKNVTDFN
ncbi:FHA domain protein (macronuclear) [Tetrahymena thermophila SB210]|uniref:FHA domain protein n=1 Tax=Tetrahymena thermophila (strain SB210) TaxID=312017 RepID=Q236X2_TETTS|nr:FHA domain protein [Tetrahymena thermophila SB210]EAR92378.1 FHA domain protein [Tetrahymena thermophila SB210]|eukprot:XP_001012623.1 FHA domain protein [Tetrahymena thermophila SB210]